MTILQAFAARGGLGPFWRAHIFVLAPLASFNCNSGDLGWTLAAPTLRLLGLAGAFGQRQLNRWARGVLHRAWQGARFAGARPDADSMVAAGER
jgi:hypothetical protein